MAGAAGATTSIFHKIKMGINVTFKSILVDTILAACAVFVAQIVCNAMAITPEWSRLVYFGTGWLGSRVIAIVEKNADKKIEKTIDRLTDGL